MSRIKIYFFALIAIAAIAAIASASASATACTKEKNEKILLCVGGSQLGVGELRTTVDTITNAVIRTPNFTMLCEKIITTAEFHQDATRVLILKLSQELINCVIDAPAHCAVANKIVTDDESGITPSVGSMLFFPTTGSVFVTFTITSSGGTCIIAGKDNVTTEGKKEGEHGPLCTIVEPEVNKEVHTIKCSGKNSHMKFLEETLEYEYEGKMTVLQSEKDASWSIYEG